MKRFGFVITLMVVTAVVAPTAAMAQGAEEGTPAREPA